MQVCCTRGQYNVVQYAGVLYNVSYTQVGAYCIVQCAGWRTPPTQVGAYCVVQCAGWGGQEGPYWGVAGVTGGGVVIDNLDV